VRSIIATIRDFAARQCGTREKRLELTNSGTNHPNAETQGGEGRRGTQMMGGMRLSTDPY